jgi:hypothetical protein
MTGGSGPIQWVDGALLTHDYKFQTYITLPTIDQKKRLQFKLFNARINAWFDLKQLPILGSIVVFIFRKKKRVPGGEGMGAQL